MKKKKLTSTARRKAKIRASRPAHKKFLLHPATVFLLLCLGVLLFGWTWDANASGPTDTTSYNVRARIPAAPLTEPATITNPVDGHHYTSVPVTISGSCPDNSYVKLYRNSIFSGVAICTAGTFSIQTDLFSGANSLQGRVFNVTDDEGPIGNVTTVYYDPHQPAPTPNSSATTPSVKPFIITSDYQYKGYETGQIISWQINVQGGTGPYGLTVDWGDNKHDTYVQKQAGVLTAEHVYKSAGSYTVRIQATDANGNHTYLELVNVVKKSLSAVVDIGGSTINLSPSQKYQWAWMAWPAYLVTLLMVLSFWLGELEESWILKQAKRPSRRHA